MQANTRLACPNHAIEIRVIAVSPCPDRGNHGHACCRQPRRRRAIGNDWASGEKTFAILESVLAERCSVISRIGRAFCDISPKPCACTLQDRQPSAGDFPFLCTPVYQEWELRQSTGSRPPSPAKLSRSCACGNHGAAGTIAGAAHRHRAGKQGAGKGFQARLPDRGRSRGSAATDRPWQVSCVLMPSEVRDATAGIERARLDSSCGGGHHEHIQQHHPSPARFRLDPLEYT